MATIYNSAELSSKFEDLEYLIGKDAPQTQEKADKRIAKIDAMKAEIANLLATIQNASDKLNAIVIDKTNLPTQADFDMAQKMQPLWDKVAELRAQDEPRNDSLNGEIVQLICERGEEFAGAVLGGLYTEEANGAQDDPQWSDHHLHEYVDTLDNLIQANQDKAVL